MGLKAVERAEKVIKELKAVERTETLLEGFGYEPVEQTKDGTIWRYPHPEGKRLRPRLLVNRNGEMSFVKKSNDELMYELLMLSH